MSSPGLSVVANGTIQPSRFVKIDTTSGKNFYVIAAAASTDIPIGISQPGSEDAPGTTGAATDAARAGQALQVYSMGDVCLLKIGSGGCTAGDRLVSDSTGQGVTSTTDKDVAGAIALETASAGELCRVLKVLTYIS